MGGIWLVLIWGGLNLWGSWASETCLSAWGQVGGLAAGLLLGAMMLQLGLVEVDATEKTLFDFLGWEVKKKVKSRLAVPGEGQKWQDQVGKHKESKSEGWRPAGTMKLDKAASVEGGPNLADSKSVVEAGETKIASALDKHDGFIRFRCACGRSIKALPKQAGKTGRCPKCGQRIQIPEE